MHRLSLSTQSQSWVLWTWFQASRWTEYTYRTVPQTTEHIGAWAVLCSAGKLEDGEVFTTPFHSAPLKMRWISNVWWDVVTLRSLLLFWVVVNEHRGQHKCTKEYAWRILRASQFYTWPSQSWDRVSTTCHTRSTSILHLLNLNHSFFFFCQPPKQNLKYIIHWRPWSPPEE